MAKYDLTTDWSADINVPANGILQVQSTDEVEVFNTAENANTTLILPGYLSSLQVTSAITIRARARGGKAKFAVIAGF